MNIDQRLGDPQKRRDVRKGIFRSRSPVGVRALTFTRPPRILPRTLLPRLPMSSLLVLAQCR